LTCAEPWELKRFENIESEWPLFYTYLYLDGLFTGNKEQTAEYRERLEKVSVVVNGVRLLPELYYVPLEYVEREKKQPHSMPRHPNENVPLIWAQSLWYLGRMIDDGLLAVGEIDPLGRHKQNYNMEPRVQVCLLAEDEELQAQLLKYGISTQVPEQIEPIQLRPARDLQNAYSTIIFSFLFFSFLILFQKLIFSQFFINFTDKHLGVNEKLGLSGRPDRPMGSLSTSRVLNINNKTCVFIPQFMDQQDFYISHDFHLLADTIKSEITFVSKHWRQPGRPTMTLLLDRHMFKDGKKAFLSLMRDLKEDKRIKLGRLQELLVTATTVRIDFLQRFEFSTQPIEKKVTTIRHYLLPMDEYVKQEGTLRPSISVYISIKHVCIFYLYMLECWNVDQYVKTYADACVLAKRKQEKYLKPQSPRTNSFNLDDEIAMSSSPQIPPFLLAAMASKGTFIFNLNFIIIIINSLF